MAQKKVRLAIIGTGAWSGAIGAAMLKSEKAELVTCFDPVLAKCEAFSKKFGCAHESSYEALLKRDDIEGVHLTTPNALHAEQTLMAARYGKHVFVDKPIANTLSDAKRMIAAFSKLYIPAPVEDVTATIMRFQSGGLGYLGSNYASPKALWAYIYGTEANLQCTVTLQELPFEQYLLRWQMIDADTSLQIYKKGETGAENIPLTPGNPILEEIDEFAGCIRTGSRPETDGESALAALALIRAAIESARTGKKAGVRN